MGLTSKVDFVVPIGSLLTVIIHRYIKGVGTVAAEAAPWPPHFSTINNPIYLPTYVELDKNLGLSATPIFPEP